MATRAHLREQITSDKIGALTPVAFATVAVYETGTTTPVAATMYQAATGVGVFTNPLTADANGVVEFWMTSAQVVDLAITAAGEDAKTVTAQVIGTNTATGILNLNTATTPAAVGDVQIATDDFTWEGAGGLKTAARLDGTQTITGAKTATALTVADATDSTKTLGWDLSGATTATKTTMKASQTVARTVTLPDATDTLVGKATADTLTNKTIDTAGSNTLKVNGNILSATAGTATVTLPNSTDTLVGRATTDTLTNKTLTGPKVDVIKDTSGNTVATITAGGGVQIGAPTGGDKGVGTLNATGLFINGVSPASLVILPWSAGSVGVQAQATTAFYGPAFQGATESAAEWVVPEALTITKLFARTASSVGGSGQTVTVTLRQNEADTTLTCSIASGAQTASDTAHSATYAAGDRLCVKVVTSASTGNIQACGGLGS